MGNEKNHPGYTSNSGGRKLAGDGQSPSLSLSPEVVTVGRPRTAQHEMAAGK